MSADAVERITIQVPPATVYQAVRDVRRMARWSPECFATFAWSRREGVGARFVGFNRRFAYVWFTVCRVVIAEPDQEFAFDVSTFGMPVSRWGYRLVAVPGGTELTEYWEDRRVAGSSLLGRIFTGRVANNRSEANHDGMRTTLARLKASLEGAARPR